MASASGRAVKTLQISTDNTTANLQELNTDTMQSFTLDRGIRTQERTRASDATVRYEAITPAPTAEFTFDPEITANRAFKVLWENDSVERAFKLQIEADSVNNKGLNVEGVAALSTSTFEREDTSYARIRISLRSNGTAWTFNDDTS